MSAPRAIEFWFEFASTYSYLSASRIEAVAHAAGVTIQWKPFLLGPIFQAQGWNDSPFNIYPAKGQYMWRDMERRCQQYGLPLRRPTQFPRNGLLAARVTCLIAEREYVADFVKSVYAANFAEDRDIADPKCIVAILDTLGQPGEQLVEQAASDAANKERLRRQTEAAVQLGIFGAPSFRVDGELFWGDDRLEAALAWGTAP